MDLSKISDEKLAFFMQKNGGEGIEQVIDRYQAKLLRYVTSIIKDQSLAEDMVQETFIAVYKNINSFDSDKKFSSWIYRIAHNKAINEIRKHSIFLGLDRIKEVSDESIDATEIVKELDKQKTKNVIAKAIKNLPIKYKEVMLLRYFEDSSYEEISDILRIPKNTVGVRITRGLALLRKNMNINIEDYL